GRSGTSEHARWHDAVTTQKDNRGVEGHRRLVGCGCSVVMGMKTTRIGSLFIIGGFTWIAINSYLQHNDTDASSHSFHSFSHCLEYSDLRCEWVLAPNPARIVLLVGLLLFACGIVVTIYNYATNKR